MSKDAEKNAKEDIEIDETFVLFGRSDDMMGFVTYQGTIGAHVPQEIHIDTENRTMSIMFENGQEEQLSDLSQNNIETVNKFYAELKVNKAELFMGFYEVDKEYNFKNSCYKVSVLVM